MPRGIPKAKPFIELGLSEAEAYAVLSALKTTLEIEENVDTITTGFGAFAAKLYRKSLLDVKEALESALADDGKYLPA